MVFWLGKDKQDFGDFTDLGLDFDLVVITQLGAKIRFDWVQQWVRFLWIWVQKIRFWVQNWVQKLVSIGCKNGCIFCTQFLHPNPKNCTQWVQFFAPNSKTWVQFFAPN